MKAVFFVALLALMPAWANAQNSIVLVPGPGLQDRVPIEMVFPLRARKDVHDKTNELRQSLLARGFRLAQDGDGEHYLAKCMVEPRQLEIGLAALRIECRSFAMWQGDNPLHMRGAPSSPKDVVAFIDRFLELHRMRLARPIPEVPEVPEPPPSLRYDFVPQPRPPLQT
jgi:hypothetical protein